MKRSEDAPEPRVKAALERLRPVSPRDPQAAARGRAAFVAQGQLFSRSVSDRSVRRHIGWVPRFSRKEISPMTTLATVVLILAVALGGTGGAVYAAQNDLPTGALYGVKLASEDARLGLAADPATRADLLLEFSQRRVREIVALSSAGNPLLEPVATRLREEVDAALQIAAGADDATRNQLLARIRSQIESDLQLMNQVQSQVSTQAAPLLDQVRTLLQNRAQLCQIGLSDPQALRDQLRDQDRLHLQTGTPGTGDQDRLRLQTGTPYAGDQDRLRLQTGTPYAGDQDRLRLQTGTPYAGDQDRLRLQTGTPETGDQDRLRLQTGTPQMGPDPSRTPEPPGSALGPGPAPSSTPEPAGTALGPGPQPTSGGPGPQPTSGGPGPQPTSGDPGPQPTSGDPGPQPTSSGPGPQPTSSGPGPQPTSGGPGGKP